MIPRYSRPEMSAIWSDESRFKIWLEIETLAFEKMVDEGLASADDLKTLRSKAEFDCARVLEIEKEVKHDVIAFLTNVAEKVGPAARVMHRGMTSSDVLDTAFAVQLKRSGELILKGLERLQAALRKRAIEHKHTVCIGRSHGIHAEPLTFGLKLLNWFAEAGRQRRRLEAAVRDVAAGKISGPVGTYASVSPQVEAHVLTSLGLETETVSTQIVHRDRHAAFFAALAGLASSLERFAVEVRHLQRTEVGEAEEKFSTGQKGSSSMPHKRNPVLSENICGLARVVRSHALAAFENVALWHERDISHSSVERVIAPDACILTDFMLQRFAGVVEDLVIYPERMRANLEATRGLYFSGPLMLALVDRGYTREESYKMVQKHAMAAFEGGLDFRQRVLADGELSAKLGKAVLDEVFDLQRQLRHVDFIFERAFRG